VAAMCPRRGSRRFSIRRSARLRSRHARLSIPGVRRSRLGGRPSLRACQICEKECPPKCIFIVKSTDKKPDALGKMQIYPARFDIDISVCMSCQICVEVCPFEAIKMDTEFELSTTTGSAGCSSTVRNCKIERVLSQHSSHEAAEVDARLADEKVKAEAKAKAAAAAAAAKAAAGPAAKPAVPSTPSAAPPAAAKTAEWEKQG